jgi:hypothetical protein
VANIAHPEGMLRLRQIDAKPLELAVLHASGVLHVR